MSESLKGPSKLLRQLPYEHIHVRELGNVKRETGMRLMASSW